MMQPRKVSRYPHPPPSLVIKPSASNSPSRVLKKTNRLTSSTSTPERMRVGQSLANEIYLGNLEGSVINTRVDDSQEELLTVSIQHSDSPEHKLHYRSQSMTLKGSPRPLKSTDTSTTSVQDATPPLSNGAIPNTKQLKAEHRDVKGDATKPERMATKSPSILKASSLDYKDIQLDAKPKESQTWQCNGHAKKHIETNRAKKSTLRQKFYDNYSSMLAMTHKVKKKVSFTLPSMERDISDVSISSHLSAISNCVVSDDEDDMNS